jgi:hypothetical protein
VPVAALVVDNLELVARFTGRPTGDTTTIAVATTGPERGFTSSSRPTGSRSPPAPRPRHRTSSSPAEAFARLVHGRLAEHTPAVARGSAPDILRRLFTGPEIALLSQRVEDEGQAEFQRVLPCGSPSAAQPRVAARGVHFSLR